MYFCDTNLLFNGCEVLWVWFFFSFARIFIYFVLVDLVFSLLLSTFPSYLLSLWQKTFCHCHKCNFLARNAKVCPCCCTKNLEIFCKILNFIMHLPIYILIAHQEMITIINVMRNCAPLDGADAMVHVCVTAVDTTLSSQVCEVL